VRVRRRRGRRFGSIVFDIVFFGAWFGIVVFWIVAVSLSTVEAIHLRESGVHANGVALSTRSETSTSYDSDTHTTTTTTDYYTTIQYTVDDKRYVEEISGSYAKGKRVDIVYDPEHPETVAPKSDVGIVGLIVHFALLAFGLGMLGFGISFVRSWYSF
jgi:hypothetical protein